MNRANKAIQFKCGLMYILLFLGVQLACTSICFGAASYFLGEDAANVFASEYTTLILAISEIMTLVILCVICKMQKTDFATYLGEDKPFLPSMAAPLIFAGIFGNIFTSLFMNLLPFSQETLDNYSNSVGTLSSSLLLADILAVALLAPIVEELIFRGLALSRMRRAMPVWAAVAFQAIIFGLIHGDLMWVIYATTFGAVLGYVRVRTGTVKASILMHIAFNASSFFASIIFILLPETRAMQAIIAMVSGVIMLLALRRIETEHK